MPPLELEWGCWFCPWCSPKWPAIVFGVRCCSARQRSAEIMWAVPKTLCHSSRITLLIARIPTNEASWCSPILPSISGHSSGYSSLESVNCCGPSWLSSPILRLQAQHMRTRRARSHKTVQYADLFKKKTHKTVCGCLRCCLPGAAPDFDPKWLDHWSWEKVLTSQGERGIRRNGSDKALTKHLECVWLSQFVETFRRSVCFYSKNIRKRVLYVLCRLGVSSMWEQQECRMQDAWNANTGAMATSKAFRSASTTHQFDAAKK